LLPDALFPDPLLPDACSFLPGLSFPSIFSPPMI
jgi:hypothetical protein